MLNEKKFRDIYDDFLASGLSIRDYCSNQQMNEAKFFYWQNKLKGQLPPKRGFVPLVLGRGQNAQMPASMQKKTKFPPCPGIADGHISCEISFPNGACLKLNGMLDADVLRSLFILTRQ
ncbi:MAG: hypothetical protein GX820_07550 [Bacteroidales bacterium]|nr:hypothetical protein [Bacteroidales bacterium]